MAVRTSTTPLFQWLLNRPPIIRQKRTYIFISEDPHRINPKAMLEHCKVQFRYGLYELKMKRLASPASTLYANTRGRHRFSFKQIDYPRYTPWFAINPSPPPEKLQSTNPDDLYKLWMSIINTFRKQNWRTEEGTKKGVEEMERKFGGDLLVESPGDLDSFM
ncbi:hypothetical protein BDN72DRAFT_841862 [Pluteus cervinus]|uniref:Uncharacterized protein n=1 Tax=Pluteus cervinus TaxID=181527 RepID=A0ACD3ARE0_9AGAR|nr:hypothetical protein BDN72DRAFT_841862 [Pluteus cervinus]